MNRLPELAELGYRRAFRSDLGANRDLPLLELFLTLPIDPLELEDTLLLLKLTEGY